MSSGGAPALDRLLHAGAFEEIFGAPGRANLIGEHTDYNDGFVLPVALDIATFVGGARSDEFVELRSLDVPGEALVSVKTGEGTRRGWGRYVTGVVRALREEGLAMSGFQGVVASDVPVGAGLSSSAALEVALASAIVTERVAPERLAKVCQRAENAHVGVRCGIMDQLVAAAAQAGHALLVDCATNATSQVPVPVEVRVLVIDSSVRRRLDQSAYNVRRSQCEEAAAALGVTSLREASLDLLIERREGLDETVFRRARHVITENQRVLEAVAALRCADFDRLRELFDLSQSSLAADFEVSTPELDALVRIAGEVEGVFAARLTGGGFGGCTVNLVAADRVNSAAAEILGRYEGEVGARGRCWISRPARGAARVRP